MKGKPIEPGCLAIIVGAIKAPENNGRIVRVIRKAERFYAPPGAPFPRITPTESDTWVVVSLDADRPLTGIVVSRSTRKVTDKFQSMEISCREPRLRRIDDGDTTEPRVTETHKPKTEVVF